MITTTLPVEVGTYLFVGSRTGQMSVRDHSLLRGSEVVRVRHDANGRLFYVGKDIFHRPAEAVGAWLRITDEDAALVEAARVAIIDTIARGQVPGAFSESWGNHGSRDCVIRHLAGPFNDAEVLGVAATVFDRAVELGIIEPETKDGYAGWWKLRSEPAGEAP